MISRFQTHSKTPFGNRFMMRALISFANKLIFIKKQVLPLILVANIDLYVLDSEFII